MAVLSISNDHVIWKPWQRTTAHASALRHSPIPIISSTHLIWGGKAREVYLLSTGLLVVICIWLHKYGFVSRD